MIPRLAILISTIEGREHFLDRLMLELNKQINGNPDVVILINKDQGHEKGGKTTGQKRNELVAQAMELNIPYCSFFDCDDYPSINYVQRQLEVVESGKDCGSIWGQIYFHGKPGLPFHHSIEFTDLFTIKTKYCRPINHLNCCLTKVRADNPFPDQVFGEDSIQALAMVGQLKTQHEVDDIVYHYFAGHNNPELEESIIKTLSL